MRCAHLLGEASDSEDLDPLESLLQGLGEFSTLGRVSFLAEAWTVWDVRHFGDGLLGAVLMFSHMGLLARYLSHQDHGEARRRLWLRLETEWGLYPPLATGVARTEADRILQEEVSSALPPPGPLDGVSGDVSVHLGASAPSVDIVPVVAPSVLLSASQACWARRQRASQRASATGCT